MPDLMTRALLPLCIMGILFAGPILLELLYLPRLHWKRDVVGTMTSLAGWRTYVVGPVTEEVVFRSCILLPLALAGMSPVSLILLTPLFFGFAHFHHARESYIQGGRTREALRVALIRSTFQFTYTYIFGLYEATSLIYTGSLYGPIMCHMLANILGFPDPGEARNYPRLRLGKMWFWGEDGMILSHLCTLCMCVACMWLIRLTPLTSPPLLLLLLLFITHPLSSSHLIFVYSGSHPLFLLGASPHALLSPFPYFPLFEIIYIPLLLPLLLSSLSSSLWNDG